jgi:probable HAF family extracellular repeat protein
MGSVNNFGELQRRAFVYDKGVLTALGTLGGSSFATGINDKGQATGGSTRDNGTFAAPHAVIYEKGKVMDLGTLGGLASSGQAINNAGQVTGTSGFNNEAYPGASTHAFLYAGGQMKDLGTLGTDLNSYGWAINAGGTVVGWSQRGPSSGYEGDTAFIYQGGQLIDLNTTLTDASHPTLARALGITDDGRIVGLSMDGRGFLLTPVPEPQVSALALIGLAAVGWAVRRHAQARAG